MEAIFSPMAFDVTAIMASARLCVFRGGMDYLSSEIRGLVLWGSIDRMLHYMV